MMKSNSNKLINTKYGLMICNKYDKYVGQSLIKYGEYSDEEVNLFKGFCEKGDSVIEVGANVGAHTLPLSKIVGEKGKIFAFEPQRIIFQSLCANISLNTLSNVFCFQKAASSKKTKLFTPLTNYNREGNFGGISMKKKGIEEVEVIILDKFLELDSLKLLKIDVEGMELEVLKGAKKIIKQFNPFIFVENDRFEKHKNLVTFINDLGYDMYWCITPLYNKGNFFKKKKNIFGNLVSSNMLCIPKSINMKLSNFELVNVKEKHPLEN